MLVRGVVVCVEYDDLLAITLPRNVDVFDRLVVVSTPADVRTAAVVKDVQSAGKTQVTLYTTDAFHRGGDRFNKGRAIEEALDVVGREGWMLLWDADTLFPAGMVLDGLEPGFLYNPPRRMLLDPSKWSPSLPWQACPVKHEPGEFPGYFQLFHAEDPVLAARPWYPSTWNNAGGCDSDFMRRWPGERKRHLPFEVLHLGQDGVNWCGRVTSRIDGQRVPQARARLMAQTELLRRRKEAHRFRRKWSG